MSINGLSESAYPHQFLEVRAERKVFTEKLRKICQKLDAQHVVSGLYTDWNKEKKPYTAEAKKLWVVGSYAKGATHCGDLDIVFDILTTDVQSSRHNLTVSGCIKLLTGSPTDVRFYFGTPKDNSSHAKFKEAKLIWDGAGCNWNEEIEEIKENQDAVRMPRENDMIPFRMEQLGPHFTFDLIERLIKAKKDGVIDWKFIPFKKDDFKPLTHLGESKKMDESCLKRASLLGKKSKAMLPAVVRNLRDGNDLWSESNNGHEYNGVLRMGGSHVFIGSPQIPIRNFEDMDLGIYSYVLATHVTKRGPNGIWVIQRGENHPHVKALNGKTFYVMEIGHEISLTKEHFKDQFGHFREMPIAEIHTSKKSIQMDLDFFNEEMVEDGGDLFQRREVKGSEILRYLAFNPAVFVNQKPFFMRSVSSGWENLTGKSSNKEVLKALGVRSPVKIQKHESLS